MCKITPKQIISMAASRCKVKSCCALLSLALILLQFLQIQSNAQTAIQSNNAINIFMFPNQLQHKQDKDDFQIKQLLTNTSHDHMSDTVSVELANSIWKKMEQNALKFAQSKAKQSKPIIDEFLNQANVSNSCKQSLNDVIDRAASLTQWAVQMWNSFGDFPPSGFSKGTLNSMGSFEECVDLEPNEYIGRPQYCSFAFQPVVPKRPKYHNILNNIKDLANFTQNGDVSVL